MQHQNRTENNKRRYRIKKKLKNILYDNAISGLQYKTSDPRTMIYFSYPLYQSMQFLFEDKL